MLRGFAMDGKYCRVLEGRRESQSVETGTYHYVSFRRQLIESGRS